MSERTPEEQASTATTPTLEEQVAELESRVEGLELLMAVLCERVEVHPDEMPDIAREVFEERYRISPTPNQGGTQ